MITVFKEFKFSGAHHLCIEGHKCSQIHGHNYLLRIECGGSVDKESGMIIDFHEIKRIVQPLIDQIDHKLLNDIIPLTTSEGICMWFHEKIGESLPLSSIHIRETDTCGATLTIPSA